MCGTTAYLVQVQSIVLLNYNLWQFLCIPFEHTNPGSYLWYSIPSVNTEHCTADVLHLVAVPFVHTNHSVRKCKRQFGIDMII